MKKFNLASLPLAIVGVLSVSISGCALTSGESAYTIKPIQVGTGEVVCCEVVVNNTKDYDKFKFNLEKKPDGTISVSLDEKGVSASDPASIAAANNAKLLDAVTAIIPKVGND